MGSTLFRDPQARSSALAALGTRALGSLNCVDPLDSVSNYYLLTVVMLNYGSNIMHTYHVLVSVEQDKLVGLP